AAATDTQIGASPSLADLNTGGISGFTAETFEQVMALNPAEWQTEIASGICWPRVWGEKKPLIPQGETGTPDPRPTWLYYSPAPTVRSCNRQIQAIWGSGTTSTKQSHPPLPAD
ncbi:MAG: hypothetical protein WCS43_19240, partial [Verrucomicrobiota bacterium]